MTVCLIIHTFCKSCQLEIVYVLICTSPTLYEILLFWPEIDRSRWLHNSFETLFRIVKLKKLHRHLSYNLSILISRPIYNKNIEMYRIICPWSQSREGFWIWKKQRKSWRQNYFPVCHQRINCCRWRFEPRNQKTFRNRLWLDTFLL